MKISDHGLIFFAGIRNFSDGRIPLARFYFNKISLDINMPLMNGMQCLQELKRSARLKHLPVIMYSTSSYKKDMDSTRDAGAADYIVKPASFSELCANIENALARNYQA
jgi:DNA-binding response OmpR family regulator